MKYRHAKVRTLDSYTYPGRPYRMEIDGQSMEIEQVLSHWREAYEDPGFYPEEFYEVQASDKKVYILRYCILFNSWWVREHRRVT
ncbi:MAG: hypothetical protein ACOX3E_01995 [Desulfomonilia bacterium]|jgi:hypothetical protein|uniref:Uncharacterized protein n=1 Tax=anaerobic digester metagenome TaxID=1263854 RepID=A0A485M145_9ZZZZ|nr:hypothetical protein [Pseudomonadota bacterium]HON39148.1 hypothetical protein [Deltaproteobacteria bacterium]HRS57004.1 hypothetical protein [Desulfomonilia bacterium]HPD20301.1 hypothetical protein [Deltaproteobacteria bacterium]HPX17687.1 hypothetical protein [Deltaproteobacteria bacterium]